MDYVCKEFTSKDNRSDWTSPIRTTTAPDRHPAVSGPVVRRSCWDDHLGQGRHYVPQMREVLHWIRWSICDRGRTRLHRTDQPGDYVYVCTYPGHWITMNGIMKVVQPSP